MDMIGGCSSYGVVILARAQFSLREDVVAAFKALRGARSAVRMQQLDSTGREHRTIRQQRPKRDAELPGLGPIDVRRKHPDVAAKQVAPGCHHPQH